MKKRLTVASVAAAKPESVPYFIWDTEITGMYLRVQPSGVKTFYLFYRVLRRKRTVRIGPADVLTVPQAREQAKQLLGKVFQGVDPAALRDQHVSFGDYLEKDYGPWVTQHRKTGAYTLERLRACFKWLYPVRLSQVDRYSVEKWISKRRESERRNTTINRDVTCLKSAFAKAVEWNFIPTSPLFGLKPLKNDSTPIVRFLKPDERVRLFRALDEREQRRHEKRTAFNAWRKERGLSTLPDLPQTYSDHLKPAVLLSLNTGLRRGELLSLRWEQIDLSERTLRVDARSSKTATTRYVPLNETAFTVLQTLHTQHGSPTQGLVFLHHGNELKQIKRSWLNLLVASKIKHFRWHDLRHDFGSQLTMKNVDLNRVRALMGHSDFKTTLRYAHLSPKDLREAVNTLETQ